MAFSSKNRPEGRLWLGLATDAFVFYDSTSGMAG
jgi:hypothetical protein